MGKQTTQDKKVYSNWVPRAHKIFKIILLAAGLKVSCAAIVYVLIQSFACISGTSVTIKRESPEFSSRALTHFPRVRVHNSRHLLLQNPFAMPLSRVARHT